MSKIDRAKIVAQLGAGMLGTTYLADIDGAMYALKIQHILPGERKEDFKNALWRELDFYKWVAKLPLDDRRFFVRLYEHRIVKCDHKQIRPWQVDTARHGPFKKMLARLDASP